jgi:isoquinoline 1-oxidoreductase beta subunit
MMENNFKVNSRRKFIATAGGATILVGGYFLLPGLLKKNGHDSDSRSLEREVNVWVRLMWDDEVIIYTPAAEMGQGSMTSVPVILAEEMDADWSKVTVLNSPIEAEIYGVGWSPGGAKNMTTAGSRTI